MTAMFLMDIAGRGPYDPELRSVLHRVTKPSRAEHEKGHATIQHSDPDHSKRYRDNTVHGEKAAKTAAPSKSPKPVPVTSKYRLFKIAEVE